MEDMSKKAKSNHEYQTASKYYDHLSANTKVERSDVQVKSKSDAKKEMLSFLSGSFVLNMFSVSDEDKEAAEPDPEKDALQLEDVLHQLACGFSCEAYKDLPMLQEAFWKQLSTHLSIGDKKETSQSSEASIKPYDYDNVERILEEDGFCVLPPDLLYADIDFNKLVQGVRELQAKGVPPIFAYVYDELWSVLHRLWNVMEHLLGESCALDPSLFLWALTPRLTAQQPGGDDGDPNIGNNFGLPHRDFSYEESFYPESGVPKIYNVWIPLTEATLNNGCLFVLPKEFDPHFHRGFDSVHMKAATPGSSFDDVLTKLRFDLQGARPLPCPPASVVTWQGNLIHWGARCSRRAKEPRMSLAGTFRRSVDIDTETHLTKHKNSMRPLRKQDVARLTLRERLRLVASSLEMYSFWYPLTNASVPRSFFEVEKHDDEENKGF